VDPTVLDTDVASLLHRGTLAGPLATRLIGREPLITFVTFGALAKWAEIRNWGQRRREELTSWLSRIAVLPGDEAVAATWGRLSAAAIRRGRPRPVNDMWIAACCLTHGIPLATLNLKDYEDFNQHHGLRVLGRGVAGARRSREVPGLSIRHPAGAPAGDPSVDELAFPACRSQRKGGRAPSGPLRLRVVPACR